MRAVPLATPCLISWLWSYSTLKVGTMSGEGSRYLERGANALGAARTTSATACAFLAISANW